jgi:CxxC motif-containing protein (DUF1111 family)
LSRCLIFVARPRQPDRRAGEIFPCRIFFLAPIIGAGPREFRTSPLWGLGKGIFFLHDGRTSDLAVAIQEHRSVGSEANAVVRNFNHLGQSQKQDIFNFLRSL